MSEMPTPLLQIEVLEHGKTLPLPAYQTEGASGMDLYAALDEAEPLRLKPMERYLVPTGFQMAVPYGFEGQVRARSGLSFKRGLTLINAVGTIDSDYRGELFVPIVNLSLEPAMIKRGERIAQLVIAEVSRVSVVPVFKLDETERNRGGFGSTGV